MLIDWSSVGSEKGRTTDVLMDGTSGVRLKSKGPVCLEPKVHDIVEISMVCIRGKIGSREREYELRFLSLELRMNRPPSQRKVYVYGICYICLCSLSLSETIGWVCFVHVYYVF